MTSRKFNRWTFIEEAGADKSKRRHILWKCNCVCGTEKIVYKENIIRGLSKSCGCYANEIRGKSSITHHEASSRLKTKEYRVWTFMKLRCLNKNSKAYSWYGARGIKVCDRWMKYENFLEDMGRCPPDMSLDRIDNDGNYEKSNCRWTDKITQANNTRANRIIYYKGKRQSLASWCRELGLRYHLTAQRMNRDGWSIERAFTDRNDRNTGE